jgi:hypothetical protein
MPRSLGKHVKTYTKPFESSLMVFVVFAGISVLSLGCTGAAFFITDIKAVWICLAVLSGLLVVFTLLGFLGNALQKTNPDRLHVHKNGFINQLENSSQECFWVDVAGLTYQCGGVLTGFTIRHVSGDTIKFDYGFEQNEKIYRKLCKETLPHLLREASLSLDDGDKVSFGLDVEATEETLTVLSENFNWDDIEKIDLRDDRDDKMLYDRQIRFFIDGAWSDTVVGVSSIENPHLFLELARERFKIKCGGIE